MNESVTYEELYHSLPIGLLESRPGQDFILSSRMDPTTYGLNPSHKKLGQFSSAGLSGISKETLSLIQKDFTFSTTSSSINSSTGSLTGSSPGNATTNTSLQSKSNIAPAVPSFPSAHEVATDLIVHSDFVFYGTVKEEASKILLQDKTESGLILMSDVVFTVDEQIKGPVNKAISVEVYAGNYDGTKLYFTNDLEMPTAWDFKKGDRYLLYLDESDGSYKVMPAGIYSIR
ncbi:hypothetical protein [Methanolapillus ohkumae]|uniref:hypothetical protein n=1 Tax=Methanolapillus ohkumae TaxID=3028298 RepID=UPI0030B8BC31